LPLLLLLLLLLLLPPPPLLLLPPPLLLLITCIRLISSRVGSARKCSVSNSTHTSYSYKLLQLVTQSANESHQ
jgi:hypothetical protein